MTEALEMRLTVEVQKLRRRLDERDEMGVRSAKCGLNSERFGEDGELEFGISRVGAVKGPRGRCNL